MYNNLLFVHSCKGFCDFVQQETVYTNMSYIWSMHEVITPILNRDVKLLIQI